MTKGAWCMKAVQILLTIWIATSFAMLTNGAPPHTQGNKKLQAKRGRNYAESKRLADT